ncbi:hypothetical protein GCM10011402_30660 [Paracoccus acridae]|uniref:Uncharacterized protein n=1 Tax=Paracoccus acridae TaxID=1795310 RepID=A0ABQ1VKI7_9RHOB|nr:hypothetical protein GCM10011402_30660 [Paracoccus acridae]
MAAAAGPMAIGCAGQQEACGRKAAQGADAEECAGTFAGKVADAMHNVARVRRVHALRKAADAVGGIVEHPADAGIRIDFGPGGSQGRGQLVRLPGQAAAKAFFASRNFILQGIGSLADLFARLLLEIAQGGLVLSCRSVVIV